MRVVWRGNDEGVVGCVELYSFSVRSLYIVQCFTCNSEYMVAVIVCVRINILSLRHSIHLFMLIIIFSTK